MATISSSDLNTKQVLSGTPGAVMYDGKLTGTPASGTADTTLRFCRIPAGTRVGEISIRITTAFAASWTANWQLVSCDGVSVPTVGGSGTATTLQAVGAVTAAKYPLSFDPVTTKVDCFLDLTITVTGTPAAGVATAVVLGQHVGAA
jgi:hypothetical protein